MSDRLGSASGAERKDIPISARDLNLRRVVIFRFKSESRGY